MAQTVEINTKPLDGLIAAFKDKLPTVKVGILGDKNARTLQVQDKSGKISTQSSSNATIGAVHEFGSSTHPRRSFLKVPLDENLGKFLEKSGAFTEDTLKEVIKSKSIIVWMKKVAAVAEKVVLEGFATRGFGKWAPWKSGYTNQTGDILVNTQQLRNSITSEVK